MHVLRIRCHVVGSCSTCSGIAQSKFIAGDNFLVPPVDAATVPVAVRDQKTRDQVHWTKINYESFKRIWRSNLGSERIIWGHNVYILTIHHATNKSTIHQMLRTTGKEKLGRIMLHLKWLPFSRCPVDAAAPCPWLGGGAPSPNAENATTQVGIATDRVKYG